MSHFQHIDVSEESGKEAVEYTFRKFSSYMPYVCLAVLIRYLIDALPYLLQGNVVSFIYSFIDMPFEAMLLTSSGIAEARLAPIWYLTAMFIEMPLFSWLLMRFRAAWPVFALLIPILYYGKMGLNVIRSPLNDMLRAFVGMTLGTVVFYAVRWLQGFDWGKTWKVIFTCLEAFAFASSIYITFGNKSFSNLLLLFFPISAALCLSGVTYSSRLGGKWCTFLAKVSLPVYLFHWDVGIILQKTSWDAEGKLIGYFVITLALAALVVLIVERLRLVLGRKRMRS